jgi:predicted RNA-binding Zn-ribbon protein involved in translation (DUF1610 family)
VRKQLNRDGIYMLDDHIQPEGMTSTAEPPAGEPNHTGAGTVPDLIRSAGERAVEEYRAFLDSEKWSPATRKAYRNQIKGFFCWAEARGRTLETVSTADRIAYAEEIASRSSSQAALVALTGVRGLYRQLAASGTLVENPFELAGSPHGKELDRSDTSSDSKPATTEQATAEIGDRRFPLLALLAMLANMEEKSLDVVLSDDVTAGNLLEFVRWRDSRECPQCGVEEDEPPDSSAKEVRSYQCPACGSKYSATTGTPFDSLPVALSSALFLLFSIYLTEEPPPDLSALARDRGLEVSDVMAVAFRLKEALAREALTAGDSLQQAIARKNREMTQDEVARDIIEYGELVAARDELIQAKADGFHAPGLPPGMTVDEALTDIEARIAVHDRYVITVEDGYLISQLADSDEKHPELD